MALHAPTAHRLHDSKNWCTIGTKLIELQWYPILVFSDSNCFIIIIKQFSFFKMRGGAQPSPCTHAHEWFDIAAILHIMPLSAKFA